MINFLRPIDKKNTVKAVEKTRTTWFNRVKSLLGNQELDETLWDELEELLISADMGINITQILLEEAKQQRQNRHQSDLETSLDVIKNRIVEILSSYKWDPSETEINSPSVVLMTGVNGAGKTTSIAKLAHMYQSQGKKVILGAADTFRAAAIEQLQIWGQELGVDVIAHKPRSDPGAVTFDTLEAATARNADVVIIDTAGRLHTNFNLMEELKKIKRVIDNQKSFNNNHVLLTLDATTGQNGIYQARAFNEAFTCHGVFLAKLDGTAKGGIVVGITDELRLPIAYIGTGEKSGDIAPFNAKVFADALFENS